ncbi:hypothetical protein B0H14DRAFT_3868614 [Mycena olivaceomarginata]|nr:hypothetical protein B0H14DRAFT_3868614 [Mycena olivaceomarginata]
MSRAGIVAMGIGKMWTGKGKRVWMKSEEENEDEGRARRDHGEDTRCRFTPQAATTGEWDTEERVGFAAHGDAAKAARSIGPRRLRLRPLPLPLPYALHALHASITGATRTPPRARPRVNREAPPVSMRISGVQDEVGGCPLLAHLCGRRLRPGPSLLLAVGTLADRRAAETAKARSRLTTPSSGPDSAVQRISDAVVALVPPIFVLSTTPEATKTDDTSGRKPVRIGTHIDGADARRRSGSGRRGREASNGARQGGETLRGEWAVRLGAAQMWMLSCKVSEARWAGDGTTPTAAQIRVQEARVL